MRVLHGLTKAHRHNQTLAMQHFRRAAEFEGRAHDALAQGDNQSVTFWLTANTRQKEGAVDALRNCGCPFDNWSDEIKEHYRSTALRADV